MAYKTLLDVTTKINRDLDLEAEEFIQPDEMTGYINDAITIVEAHMNTMGLRDQYFLTRTTMSITQGVEDYELPTNIYENKIKQILYHNGATLYTLKPMTADDSAEDIEYLKSYASNDYYRYRVRNDSSTEVFLQLIPKANDTLSDVIIIEYFRDVERVSDDSDKIELPEIAIQYLYQYVKVKVYEKETHSNYQSATAELMKLEGLMLDTLRGQINDPEATRLNQDFTFYEEMS